MDPGAAIVTRPSQKRQVIDHSPKALATKCIFQNYLLLLDIRTRLVLKPAEKLFVPSVDAWENTRVFALFAEADNICKV